MASVDNLFVKADYEQGALHALIRCEKVGERETEIILADLIPAAEASGWKLVLDVGEVGLLASAGIGGFVTLHQRCKQGGGAMAVYNVSDELMSLMKLTRLNKLFKIVKNREAAFKAVA